jgi:hypothetical protein
MCVWGEDQDDVWNMDCGGELLCAVERKAVRWLTRHEPQDLSVTVELGLRRTLGYQVR